MLLQLAYLDEVAAGTGSFGRALLNLALLKRQGATLLEDAYFLAAAGPLAYCPGNLAGEQLPL